MALLLGKLIADRILSQTKERIHRAGVTPRLAVILAGDDLESHKYVALKEARAQEVGVALETFFLPKTVTTQEFFSVIDDLNKRTDVHGIIVQLPLPQGLPTDDIISRIDPKKDTDGFHEETLRHFLGGDQAACPVFPRAMIEMIRETGRVFHGEQAVAVVNSDLMGKVMAHALLLENLESVYVLSTETREVMAEKTKTARVVVTACGIPDLLTADMLNSDAIVIDGGNVHVNEKVQGDVKRDEVERTVAFLSPVPGGVGPVTVATLLARVTDAALTNEG
jgi:methylenetetrahydrofolate dehydrogenase (NADP+) / methenyltetrahydrofolate cyclohydrolase